MNCIKICISILFTLLQLSNLKSQDPILRLFSAEDGLPGGKVYHSIQDKDGYIWSATERGITRYDGNQFTLFTVKDGLPSNDVWQIAEGIRGRLWVGTFLNISYIENGKVKILDSNLSAYDKEIFKHAITPLGHIVYSKKTHNTYLLSTNDSLVLVHNKLRPFEFENEPYLIENAQTSFLFKNKREQLKVSDRDSLLLSDQSIIIDKGKRIQNFLTKNGKKINALNSLSSNRILIVESSGELWLADNSGISPLSLKHLFTNGTNENFIQAQQIGSNKIWLKTNLGNYVTDSTFHLIHEFDFLNNYSINTILLDRQQNLWLSTDEGLYFINKKSRNAKTYRIDKKIGKESIKFLAINSHRKILGLSGKSNLYQLNYDEGLQKIDDFPQIIKPSDLEFDFEDNLWIGGDYLIKIDHSDPVRSDKTIIRGLNHGTFMQAIKRILFHENGSSLMSKYNHATSNFDLNKNEWIIYSGRYYGLALKENGDFWLSGKDGIKHVDKKGNEIPIPNRNELKIFDLPTDNIALSKKGKLWIGVNNKGLYRYDGKRVYSIIELNNILIQSLQIDSKNRLWASTNVGLAKISNFQSSPVKYDFDWYTEIDGLISNDVKEVVFDEENIIVATEKGVTVLQDLDNRRTKKNAPFHFSSLTINGKDTTLLDSYELNYSQNSLTISYECLDFENLGNLIFQYKMEGIDSEWKETSLYQKEYPLLTPGEYTFQIRRKPNHALTSTQILNIHFVIKEAFLRRTWVQFTLFLLASLLAFLYLQHRIHKIKKRAKEEIAIKQKFAKLELKVLQSQMNPHFVFNALDSIQHFIFKKDERVANRYLVKFSRLMRLFLESSKEKYIFLVDEIKLLQLYIELEKLRFEDKFEFVITIDDHISPGTLEIPSMLLQPFVENAINHGLVHRADSGKLSISFFKESGKLCCRIEDNGIGRKKALKIKAESIKSYKSRGTQLVGERQKIWNEIGNSAINISIEDLYDKDQIGIGTRVDISINLEE